MTNMSFSTDDNLKRELEAHARLLDRPKSWVINAALQTYLAHQKWIGDAVQGRLDLVASGKAVRVSHADAVKRLRVK